MIQLEIYCSRADTVKELISRICSTDEFNELSDRLAEDLANNCRLWKMEGDETF